MIAVETSILVDAHRKDSRFHSIARASLQSLAEGTTPWAIPWQSIHEFLGVATHPGIFEPPSTMTEAVAEVEGWFGSPTLVLLTESEDHWKVLGRLLGEGRITGPRVHDARIAAICLAHGVSELWTRDRDFHRFPALRVRNPLA